MKPTIFVSIDGSEPNPVQVALNQVTSAFGAQVLDQLVSGDVEAQIAVTNSVSRALRMVKETEHTVIALCYLYKGEKEEAQAFATRFPDRVFAVPFAGASDQESEIVPFLLKLITEKTKGGDS